MQVIELSAFGLDKLEQVDREKPAAGPGEVLVRFEAASVNPRDYQIITGQFTPNVPFPLVPLSDGAGIVEAVGEGISRVSIGDRVTPTFFPKWISGEALHSERSVSSGLEAPGTLREYGVYLESAVVRAAPHLSAPEAACFPCAGLTAWTALVTMSRISPGDTVLLQGTGGVAMAGLSFAKALGAQVIILSSSDQRLERARELGADHCINYVATADWGSRAYEIAGHGVDAVIEIGGTGTLENSLAAIRHGGHVNIIGYMTGIDMDITVFPLIIKNAQLHGIGTGNRDSYEAMVEFVSEHEIRPKISSDFSMTEAATALETLAQGGHMGKIIVNI
jgi:NADPH:quinone reductase-like Zn-dependent oxidoreductase